MSDVKNASEKSLPETDLGTPGVNGTREVPKTISHLIALQKKLDAEQLEASRLHELAAPFFAALVEAVGGCAAAATILHDTDQHINDKCAGTRGVRGYEYLILMAADPDCFQAGARIFCELHKKDPPQPKRALVRDDVAEMLIELALESEVVMDALLKKARQKKGAAPDDVFFAMASK